MMTSSHRYKIPEEERVPAHVSQVSNTKYISVVLDKLDAQQKIMFLDSCLGHVARLQELKLSAQLIHEMVSRSVVCRKRCEAWFMVNQRLSRFGLSEYALITGLKCGNVPTGDDIDKILQKTRLQSKLFASMDRITCSDLEKVFLKCANRNDRYKLGLALIIEGVFNSRDRNVGIHPSTLSIVDDLDVFNSYPWGTVCFQILMKSLLRGWARKADLVKVNDCDRMTYTLYGFPLAVQIWAYEAIPELGARFATKTCDDIPRMLRWSVTKHTHARTYADFFQKTKLQLWATLRATAAELVQPYFVDLVPLGDVADPVLDDLVTKCTEIQVCALEDDDIQNDDSHLRAHKSRRGNTAGATHRSSRHAELDEEDDGDPVLDLPSKSTSSHHRTERHVSVDDIRALLNEQREAFERRLGDLRDEMNKKFEGVECVLRSWGIGLQEQVSGSNMEIESRLVDMREEMNIRFGVFEGVLGGHVTGLRAHVTTEMEGIRHRFDEVATKMKVQSGDEANGGYGHHDDGGFVPRTDVFTPNSTGDSQNPKVMAERNACNVPDVSITSAGEVGVLGSVYVSCDIVKDAPHRDIVKDAPHRGPTADVPTDDQVVQDIIVAGPSMQAQPPTRRARSLRIKRASANTKTPFTRSGRKRVKRDV